MPVETSLLRMEGGGVSSTEFLRVHTECPIPLEVLDFIYDFTQPDLELVWPCHARSYWLGLQPFVRFVRVLLNYVTPFIIIIGEDLSSGREKNLNCKKKKIIIEYYIIS